ncbi:MAG: nucleotide exchange factor GrpE [Planctomycetota bacterium]|nr:nucleotide exchange factor GrpE [Planctomycetota bacterium]
MSNEKENNVTEPAEAEVGEHETPEAAAAPEPEEKDYRELYLRTLAELDNYGKRVERDREQGRRYAAENLMRSLLPVLDTLELAVGAAGEADDVCKGVQLALDDFLRILRDRGMEPIEALDQPFDPRYHEAVGMLPDPELPAGTVVKEERRGYRLNDRILRASRVQISVQPPKPAKEAEADPAPDTETEED